MGAADAGPADALPFLGEAGLSSNSPGPAGCQTASRSTWNFFSSSSSPEYLSRQVSHGTCYVT